MLVTRLLRSATALARGRARTCDAAASSPEVSRFVGPRTAGRRTAVWVTGPLRLPYSGSFAAAPTTPACDCRHSAPGFGMVLPTVETRWQTRLRLPGRGKGRARRRGQGPPIRSHSAQRPAKSRLAPFELAAMRSRGPQLAPSPQHLARAERCWFVHSARCHLSSVLMNYGRSDEVFDEVLAKF